MSNRDRASRAADVFARKGTPGVTSLPTAPSRLSVDVTREEYNALQMWLVLSGQAVGRRVNVREVFRILLAELMETDDQGDVMPDAAALSERVRARIASGEFK